METLQEALQWLLSIPRHDIPTLSQTPEYSSFLAAFGDLERAHRSVIDSRKDVDIEGRRESLLQQVYDDDVILRIFEFLNCHSLVQMSETCSRFQILCNLSAKQRTTYMDGQFYLESYMKLLRAKEQAEGIMPHCHSVRVPLLGLQKRVIVNDCGDSEYNGIYYCTGQNGNGYLFTKPRFDYPTTASAQSYHPNWGNDVVDDDSNGGVHRQQRRRIDDELLPVNNDQEEDIFPGYPSRFPRCVISKRFSNQTILWYMSKELQDEHGRIKQEYSFWSKLMLSGEGALDTGSYPSQTSILSRNGNPAWRSLSGNLSSPPTVELLE